MVQDRFLWLFLDLRDSSMTIYGMNKVNRAVHCILIPMHPPAIPHRAHITTHIQSVDEFASVPLWISGNIRREIVLSVSYLENGISKRVSGRKVKYRHKLGKTTYCINEIHSNLCATDTTEKAIGSNLQSPVYTIIVTWHVWRNETWLLHGRSVARRQFIEVPLHLLYMQPVEIKNIFFQYYFFFFEYLLVAFLFWFSESERWPRYNRFAATK